MLGSEGVVNYPSLRKGLRGEFASRRWEALSPRAGSRRHYPLSFRTHGLLSRTSPTAVQPYGCYVVIPYNFKFKLNYPPASPVSPRFAWGLASNRKIK